MLEVVLYAQMIGEKSTDDKKRSENDEQEKDEIN